MRLFNSFQIVAAFVAWPFLVGWLFKSAPFYGSEVAGVAACVLYAIAFGAMVAAVYTSTEHWDKQ